MSPAMARRLSASGSFMAGAQRLRRQRHAARAQGFQFRIAREGLALAFALLSLVLVALTRVFI